MGDRFPARIISTQYVPSSDAYCKKLKVISLLSGIYRPLCCNSQVYLSPPWHHYRSVGSTLSSLELIIQTLPLLRFAYLYQPIISLRMISVAFTHVFHD